MIDFGLSKRWIDINTKKHLPPHEESGVDCVPLSDDAGVHKISPIFSSIWLDSGEV